MHSYKQPGIVTFLGYVALLAGVASLIWTIVHMVFHLM
jgi:H+/Cl- antiporter ClcA